MEAVNWKVMAGVTAVVVVPIIYELWKFFTAEEEINEAFFPSTEEEWNFKAKIFQTMRFRPDKARRGAEMLSQLIAEAKSTIDVAMFLFCEFELSEAVLAAKKRGVEVRCIFDRSSKLNSADGAIARKMIKNGIRVKTPKIDMMHIKMCLIDVALDGSEQAKASRLPANGLTITGSMNWTREGLTSNQEMFIVTSNKDICQRSKRAYEVIWMKAEDA